MVYPAKQHVIKTFEHLAKLLPASERTKPQVLLLAGGITEFRNDTDRELVFRQESNFYYLTGCTVPSSFVLAAYQPGTSLESNPSVDLFIPKANLEDMMWSVPPPSLEAAKQVHDVTAVDYTTALPAAIDTLLKALPEALFHTLPRNSPLFPTLPAEYTQQVLSADGAVTDLYLLSALQTAQISSRAHETVMRVLGAAGAGVTRPLLPGEWLIEKEAEAEAIFVASCRREDRCKHSCSTLHYCCNDKHSHGDLSNPRSKNKNDLAHNSSKELDPQVLLIDAGCEWNCYASDITRTMPVGNGGKFTPEARAIYELVLEMQKQSFDIIKPGLHWDAVQLICHRTLVKGFQKLGIFKSPDSPGSGSWNSEEAILASGVSAAFFPHGVGHSMGMDVHDVPSASKPAINPTTQGGVTLGHESFYSYLRLRLPLEVGMVVTVEPGIYFSPHLLAPIRDSKHINHDILKKYESVGGVRIEDDIVIIAEGYKNLTTVRSDVEWIESVCSGEI
ncbi:metallopeptidase family M24-domain-containing protein [Pholiota molesta]|nr:metallopeptidase family M24-domain-containing protein [Pholiota molesta]